MSYFNKLISGRVSISNESDVVEKQPEEKKEVEKVVDEQGNTEVPKAEKAPETDLEDEVKEVVAKESRVLPHVSEAKVLHRQIAALESLRDILVNNVSLESNNTLVESHLTMLKTIHGISIESEGANKESLLRRISKMIEDLRSKVKNFFKGFTSEITLKDYKSLIDGLEAIKDEERYNRLREKASHRFIVNGKFTSLKEDGKRLNTWVTTLETVVNKVSDNYRNTRLDGVNDAEAAVKNLLKGVDLTKLNYDLGYCSAKFDNDISANAPAAKRVMYFNDKANKLTMPLSDLIKCVKDSRDEFDEIKRSRGFAQVANRILKVTYEMTRRVYNDANTELTTAQINYGNEVLKLIGVFETVLAITYTEVYYEKGLAIYKTAHKCF